MTDFGGGILNALTTVDKYKAAKTSIQAIELAVKEGVTSRVDKVAGFGSHTHPTVPTSKQR